MSPILGIMASSISGSKSSTTAYESIATSTVGSGGAASVTFSSIPATYTHLQIRGIMKQAATSVDIEYLLANFNSDTGANYTYHNIRSTGAAVTVGSGTALTTMAISVASPSSHSSYLNMFGAVVIDILDYANTNKYKTVRTLGGMDGNGSGNINFNSDLWRSTAAINSITLNSQSFNLSQYSSFALYGIKGA